MTFISLEFLLFFLFGALIFYLIPKKTQWGWLLFLSCLFFLFASLRSFLFVLAVGMLTYACGVFLDRLNVREGEALEVIGEDRSSQRELKQSFRRKRGHIVFFAVFFTLLILVGLKYSGFAAANLGALFALLGFEIVLPDLNFLLPLGISFYTFQSIGYVIDVSHREISAQKNFLKYLLFVSFFPQCIMGPIQRYKELAPQLFNKRKFNYTKVTFGLQLMLWGFFKKLVVADRLGIFVDNVYGAYNEYQGLYIVIATVFYAFQVYADFSGCIDIARGASEVFGIEMAKNFERPYFSKNVAEFWRRWHISLGAWFRDYVFYPLSTSKALRNFSKKMTALPKAFARTLPNAIGLMTVWILNGIWHGAAWKYIFFGIYYGVIIVMSMWLEPWFKDCRSKMRTNTFAFKLFQVLRTFCIVVIADVFFRAPSLSSAFQIIKNALSQFNAWILFDGSLLTLGLDGKEWIVAVIGLVAMLIVSMLQRKESVRKLLAKQNLWFRWVVLYALLFFVLIYGMYGTGVSSTEFIYMQF